MNFRYHPGNGSIFKNKSRNFKRKYPADFLYPFILYIDESHHFSPSPSKMAPVLTGRVVYLDAPEHHLIPKIFHLRDHRPMGDVMSMCLKPTAKCKSGINSSFHWAWRSLSHIEPFILGFFGVKHAFGRLNPPSTCASIHHCSAASCSLFCCLHPAFLVVFIQHFCCQSLRLALLLHCQ